MDEKKPNKANELNFQKKDIQYELKGIDDILSLLETEENEIISVQADPLQGAATKVVVPLEIAPEIVSKLRDFYSDKLGEMEK
jgi:hypothetical protein